ncbi:MAG: TRC40/GET3/ArsA family transport-energizing ATPase [Syntrophobacteria bacterium]
MRILLYAGKGGVGKTCVAGATGIITARTGLKTLVMSLDPAHSLSDAFDLDRSLMDKNRGQPIQAGENLWVQELDVHEEISKHWREVHSYLSLLLNTSGIDDVLAEELAILPGMEEINALLYINKYVREQLYDLIILDCAPTAESMRFISMPTALEWYMKKVFRLERKIFAYVRPVARRMVDIPLPEDKYFANIERLYNHLQGMDRLLSNPETTSVRLVTNPEKMVLRETQRAFMFFSLHQMTIDAIIMNRVFPSGGDSDYLKVWGRSQQEYLDLAETYFHPLPIFKAPLHESEILGYQKLLNFGEDLYEGKDPTQIFSRHRTYEFLKENGRNLVKLYLPFASKEEVELSKVGDELIIRIGNFKKNIILPRAYALLEPQRARLEENHLRIDFGGSSEQGQERGEE